MVIMTEYQLCDGVLFNVSRYDSNAVHSLALRRFDVT